MADLEDVVEAICKGDYTTAQKRLEIIIRDILNKHEYPGVKIEKVWIRPCNGEICIDVVFAPSFGRHASIPMYILVELCDTIWDISQMLFEMCRVRVHGERG